MKQLFRKNIYSVLLLLLMVTVVACGGETKKEESAQKTKPRTTITQSDSVAKAKLNINTASEKAFRTIPGVGDKMVHEFEEYRPYVSIQQFRKEIGKYVDEDRVAAYEQYIYVPIHRNNSDAATLMQIPGLDKKETEKLISGRPYETNQAFLDSLSSYINQDQMTTAQSYLKSE